MKHVIVIETVDPGAGGRKILPAFKREVEQEIASRIGNTYGMCIVRSQFNVESAIEATHEMYNAPKWNAGETYRRMVVSLKESEKRLVGLYRSINPHANYEDQNRMADQDEVVSNIRAVLTDAGERL